MMPTSFLKNGDGGGGNCDGGDGVSGDGGDGESGGVMD